MAATFPLLATIVEKVLAFDAGLFSLKVFDKSFPPAGRSIDGNLISHTVFIKSLCRNQLPHKSFNLFFI